MEQHIESIKTVEQIQEDNKKINCFKRLYFSSSSFVTIIKQNLNTYLAKVFNYYQ